MIFVFMIFCFVLKYSKLFPNYHRAYPLHRFKEKSIRTHHSKFEVIWIKTEWDRVVTVSPKFALERNRVAGKLTLNIFFRIFCKYFANFANFVAIFCLKRLILCFYVQWILKLICKMSLPRHLCILSATEP